MSIRIYHGASHYCDSRLHDHGPSYRCRRVSRINEFETHLSYAFEDYRAGVIIAHTSYPKKCTFGSTSE